jgi:hypothetical protein
MRSLGYLFAIILAAPALAQYQQPEAVTQACKSAEALPLPKPATGPPPMEKPGEPCDPLALYYGITGKPDYAAARRCALAEWRSNYKFEDDAQMSDLAAKTLLMIYANGDGVPQDVDRAIRIACADEPSPPGDSWWDQFVADLLEVKADPKHRYDFCAEDKPGKMVMYECEWIRDSSAESKSGARLAHAMASWTPAQKAAYAPMMKAHKLFVDDYYPVGGCGSGVREIASEDQSALRVALMDSIVAFDSGRLPNFTHADYLAADKSLNAAYPKQIADLASQGD